MKKDILSLLPEELEADFAALGQPKYRAGQVFRWLGRGVRDFDGMSDLPKSLREKLKEEYFLHEPKVLSKQVSKIDGTIKYLFPTENGKFVETVYIPDNERATLCVSSQVGCKMNCLFCQTGKQGFEGNLTAADILNQICALP